MVTKHSFARLLLLISNRPFQTGSQKSGRR